MKRTRALLFLVVAAVLAEVGDVIVMLNARPHVPLGFWLWFGGVSVLAPLVPFWLYRRPAERRVD